MRHRHLIILLGCTLIYADAAKGSPPLLAMATGAAGSANEAGDATGEETGASRKFTFHYRFDVFDLVPKERIRLWLPVPPSNEYQKVTAAAHKLPATPEFHTEPKYGNRILYLEARAPASGRLQIDVPYRIVRQEVKALASQAGNRSSAVSKLENDLFLKANAKVPITGKPLDLLTGISLSRDQLELANQLYNVVDSHVTYNKDGSGWGNGDVLWVCDSRRGNCTDFHSLFISLARSQGIPARFEIGFPVPSAGPQGAIGGYHCWAWFFTQDRGWIPVDISEADKHPSMKDYYFGSLTADRVMFSTGRDIDLVPASNRPSMNYFVYPHIESGGKIVSRKQIDLKFSYTEDRATPKSN